MNEKKGKLDLKGLKNLFGTKKSSINMDEKEDNNFDTENSHLDDVIYIFLTIILSNLFCRRENQMVNCQKEKVMKESLKTSVLLKRRNQQMIYNSF